MIRSVKGSLSVSGVRARTKEWMKLKTESKVEHREEGKQSRGSWPNLDGIPET